MYCTLQDLILVCSFILYLHIDGDFDSTQVGDRTLYCIVLRPIMSAPVSPKRGKKGAEKKNLSAIGSTLMAHYLSVCYPMCLPPPLS